MLRFTVQTTDWGDAVHVGGPVLKTLKTFTAMEMDAMERHLWEYQDCCREAREKKQPMEWNRQLIGFEIAEDP